MEPSELPSVLSYIHLFAEHTHTKVIFICDENKIEKACKFPSIKEKYIRYTFRYEADLQSIIQINRHVPDEYKPLIKDIFERGNCFNIRTLKQVLSQFKDIVKWVNEAGIVPAKWLNEATKSVILFQCFYTIEKTGVGMCFY